MTTLSIGSLCTIRRHGAVLWVATEPKPDNRYQFTAKLVDERGRVGYRRHTAGLCDVTLIKAPEVFKAGQTLRYAGLDHIVLEDRGDDDVELGVLEHGVPTKGGEVIRIPGTNVRTLSKADLALAAMSGSKKE